MTSIGRGRRAAKERFQSLQGRKGRKRSDGTGEMLREWQGDNLAPLSKVTGKGKLSYDNTEEPEEGILEILEVIPSLEFDWVGDRPTEEDKGEGAEEVLAAGEGGVTATASPTVPLDPLISLVAAPHTSSATPMPSALRGVVRPVSVWSPPFHFSIPSRLATRCRWS